MSRHRRAMRILAAEALALSALVLVGLASTLGAASETISQRETDMITRGSLSYHLYCANCHGARAKGDGSLVKFLTVKPPDLTLLAQRNDGTFPADRVRRAIDGRDQIQGHGLREMPVWGDAFQDEEGTADSEKAVEQKIDELVTYLKVIQQRATAKK